MTEAATETILENICSFLPGAPFFWIFSRGFMCSPNRCQFSRKVYLFVEQITIFRKGMSVHRTDINFLGAFFFSFRTEQIPFFQKHFFWSPNRFQKKGLARGALFGATHIINRGVKRKTRSPVNNPIISDITCFSD